MHLSSKIEIGTRIASGVEADVFYARSQTRGKCVIKVFKAKTFHNQNDGTVHSIDIATKEKEIIDKYSSSLIEHIDFFDVNESQSHVWITMPYLGNPITSNDYPICYNQLEEFWEATHSESTSIDDLNKSAFKIAHATYFRAVNMLNDANRKQKLTIKSLYTSISIDESPHALLHMDFRPPNILNIDGKYNLIDWSNALYFHTDLERARVLELVETPKSIKERINQQQDVNAGHFLVYRLYTTAMLANLFKNVMLNESLYIEYFSRSVAILEKLGEFHVG